MFSAVLMVAMVGGGEVADRHGCCGGGCCGGCYGCYGCCGGGRGHGCCGGGKHSRGCCGGCYGCCGCWGGYGCCGGWGCMGGCYGGGYGGCMGGCYGGGFGGCMGGYGGCMGGYGGVGCIGGASIGVGGVGGAAAPVISNPVQTQQHSQAEAPATIIVNVPTEAKVTIDGVATTSTSARRVFVSPSLDSASEYHYTLQADFQQEGKSVSVKKVVTVRGGQQTEVSMFANEATDVASR